LSWKPAVLSNTFHHGRYGDPRRLLELKEARGATVSLAFPTLNEADTIGKEILVLKAELMERFPLVDEIAVIDSGSTDDTRAIAARFGARVFGSRDILKPYGTFRGKGENLWKSLFVLQGDIIVWIDADISNIGPKFVYGLLGPLLERPEIGYVKAFYERPLRSTSGLTPSGGGRVTEILVRPLFSLFYPELAGLVQPLSGEYAGRRRLLERLPFSVGYGVEVGHLIDIYHQHGIESLAQVDLDRRVHRNQPVEALSRMSFGILNTFLSRLERYGEAHLLRKLAAEHIALAARKGRYSVQPTAVPMNERPPMVEIPEYAARFPRAVPASAASAGASAAPTPAAEAPPGT
jgi:glucosyl-3-phosphoglycerate synthase